MAVAHTGKRSETKVHDCRRYEYEELIELYAKATLDVIDLDGLRQRTILISTTSATEVNDTIVLTG